MADVNRNRGREILVECLRSVARGDKTAMKPLYRHTSAKLFGVCLRILNDREEAEDVLQDVYLTIWNRAESFDPTRASPITWLAVIARNRSIDRLRQISPRSSDETVDDSCRIPDSRPDGFEILHRVEESRRLAVCLDGLDERTRNAIGSAFFSGRTYEELARQANVPLGTMKSMIRRGLIKLKGCLSR